MGSPNCKYDCGWKKLLPIGFHFLPTDEELNIYLKLKSCDGNIPPGIFSDLDIYQYEPQQLSGFAEKHWDGRMYFFTPLRKKYDNGSKIGRTIHSGKGYWKASQARKNLCNKNNFNMQMSCESSFQFAAKEEKGDVIIGTKTSLVYHELGSKNLPAKKTSWLMLEYRFPIKFDPLPLFDGTNHELTLCVIYYHDTTKKNDDNQIAMLTESNDPIPLQTLITQKFDHSPYTPHQENSYSYPNNFVSNCTPIQQYQPLTNKVTKERSVEYYSLQQYQPLINKAENTFHPSSQSYTEVATTSTIQQSFPQLPYGVMESLDIFTPIPQNNDFHGFDPSISQYFNFDNFPCIEDEKIGHIPNSNIDFVDQNELETSISQGDQRPSSDNQDHQQPKMKKIKIQKLINI